MMMMVPVGQIPNDGERCQVWPANWIASFPITVSNIAARETQASSRFSRYWPYFTFISKTWKALSICFFKICSTTLLFMYLNCPLPLYTFWWAFAQLYTALLANLFAFPSIHFWISPRMMAFILVNSIWVDLHYWHNFLREWRKCLCCRIFYFLFLFFTSKPSSSFIILASNCSSSKWKFSHHHWL